jgi:hypothetical protein
MKLLIMQFSLFGANILLNTPFSNTLSLWFYLNVTDQVSHPYKTTSIITVLYGLILTFLDSRREAKMYGTDRWEAFPKYQLYKFTRVKKFSHNTINNNNKKTTR